MRHSVRAAEARLKTMPGSWDEAEGESAGGKGARQGAVEAEEGGGGSSSSSRGRMGGRGSSQTMAQGREGKAEAEGEEERETSGERDFTCAICYESQLPWEQRAALPCCGSETSSTQYCQGCIRVIIERGSIIGGIGKCPTCSAWLAAGSGGGFITGSPNAKCRMCNQVKEIADGR